LGAVVYFADPYASWQKGAIENTNKLIRQYIPKKANFDDFTDKKIANIQKKINRRPRQKTKFSNTKMRVLQKNIIILHLLVDSATAIIRFLILYFLANFLFVSYILTTFAAS